MCIFGRFAEMNIRATSFFKNYKINHACKNSGNSLSKKTLFHFIFHYPQFHSFAQMILCTLLCIHQALLKTHFEADIHVH